MLALHDRLKVLLSEPVECVSRNSVLPAYGGDAATVIKHTDYFGAVVDKLLQFGVTAFSSSEYDALFASKSQCFSRTHGYEVALDFGHQPECKAKNLTVDRVVEGLMIFRTVKMDLFFEEFAHYSHNIRECTAKAR